MTSKIAAYGVKKILGPELTKYADKKVGGDYDPLYEMRPTRGGKMKKCKKLIPAYIPEHDGLILAKVRKRAYKLDMALFTFAGIRFGWSSVIGIIPAVGDGADMAMALTVYRMCCKVEGGLDQNTKMKMMMWILLDFIIGLVPFLGDMLDAAVKANTQNCRLLEQHLDAKWKPDAAKKSEKEKRQSVAGYKPPAPATAYEDMDEDDFISTPPGARTPVGGARTPEMHESDRQQRAHNGRSGRERLHDEEMALPAPVDSSRAKRTDPNRNRG